ncbi:MULTISPECIES: hypothetical protein [Photorhabdus]|uniref:hypothetical protein n=1 Tax=Photorhabdus TaxID=29487 RepID=UPI000ADC9935|nr:MULTISPECIES: hypothetical protein [Photorhabdus]NRN27654.1 hypothetical protein [Photorhabdus heterorhabditis subsp. aluminescens]
MEIKADYINNYNDSVSQSRIGGKGGNHGVDMKLIKADVLICDKDEFGPLYFIDF